MITSGTHDRVTGKIADRPWQHSAFLLPFQRVGDVFVYAFGRGNDGKPQFPETAIAGGRGELVGVLQRERLKANVEGLQKGWLHVNHIFQTTGAAAELSRPRESAQDT